MQIIGAGIGGLTAAIALHRAGFDVAVYERMEQFSPVGAGIVLAPNAIQLLARVGVDINSAGYPIASMRVRDVKGRTIQQSDFRRFSTNIGNPFAFDRAELHRVLLNSLPANFVQLGRPYSAVERRGAEEILIGADGIYSEVRTAVMGAVRPVRYSGQTCWRGLCANPGVTETFEAWGGATRIGVVPLKGDRIYVFLVKECASGMPREHSLAAIRDEFAKFADPVPAVLDSLDCVHLLHHDLEELTTPVWGRGRTLLIGDAAHAMTPNLGQGAGMAIEDAVVLPKVIRSANPADELRQLRHERVSQLQRSSRLLGKLAHWQRPWACGLRDTLLRAIPQRMSDSGYARMIEGGFDLADRKN